MLGAASALFRERGYNAASVAAICRRAGLANGTFYRYFTSKEQVFRLLAQELGEGLAAVLREPVTEREPVAVWQQVLDRLFTYLGRHRELFQIFREAEFVDLELSLAFYRQVIDQLTAAIPRLFPAAAVAGGGGAAWQEEDGGRPAALAVETPAPYSDPELPAIDPEVAAVGVLGAAYLTAVRWLIWEGQPVPTAVRDAVADVLAWGIAERGAGAGAVGPDGPLADSQADRGLGTGAMPDPSAYPGPAPIADPAAKPGPAPIADPAVAQEGSTRGRLLAAAERCFAEMGFYGANITDITRLAGVAQGTFYVHFPSKLAALQEVVREINRTLRREIRQRIEGIADRRQAEPEGFAAFFEFLQRRPGIYRIVREAEFVDLETGRWYYGRMAEGYVRALRAGIARGELRPVDPEAAAYALLGAGHLSGVWWLVWRQGEARGEPRQAGRVLRGLARLVLYGLAGTEVARRE